MLRQARNARQLAQVYERLARSVEVLSELAIVSFTEPAILRYEALRNLRLNIGKNDLRIAAIVLQNQAILVTRNLRDFQRVPNLAVENWAV